MGSKAVNNPNHPSLMNLRSQVWLDALSELCSDILTGSSEMVELGAYSGESATVFAAHCKRLFSVDPWDESYKDEILLGCADSTVIQQIGNTTVLSMRAVEDLFDQRVALFGARVVKIRKLDTDALSDFEEKSLDFVYVDTVHTYESVKETILKWIPKIKDGKWIGGHDYCLRSWPGVVRAVDELFGKPEKVYADTSWVARVRTIA